MIRLETGASADFKIANLTVYLEMVAFLRVKTGNAVAHLISARYKRSLARQTYGISLSKTADNELMLSDDLKRQKTIPLKVSDTANFVLHI